MKIPDLTQIALTTLYRQILEAAGKLMGEPDFIEKGKRDIYIYRDLRMIKKISGRCRVDIYIPKGTMPLTNKFLLQLILNQLKYEFEVSKRVPKPERKTKGSR